MDISVSQLNHRLALQLPPELPLGLVFVTGVIKHLERTTEGEHGRSLYTLFDLEQNGHRLRCKLAQREAERIAVRDDMEVRLGGHLTFDAHRAEYYLLARDAEVLSGEVDPLALDLGELVDDQAAFTAALVGIRRRADIARQTSPSMPDWVQKIAPPELQEDIQAEPSAEGAAEFVAQTPSPQLLDGELVTYLSTLMDSEEEVELTPDLLSQWLSELPAKAPEKEKVTAVSPAPTAIETEAVPDMEIAAEQTATAVSPYDLVGDTTTEAKTATAVPPPAQAPHQTDWLVIVLLVAMVMFTIVICFAAVFLR